MSARHNIQYSTETIDVDIDLNEYHDICQQYINEVEELL